MFKTTVVATALHALLFSSVASADIIDAASCSQPDVQAALDSAADGDTIVVPAGNCMWSSGLLLDKGVHLQGAGASVVTIEMGSPWVIVKHPDYNVEISGMTFTASAPVDMFNVLGAHTSEPPLFHDNVVYANLSGQGVFRYQTTGGVIYRNVFHGGELDTVVLHKLGQPSAEAEWNAPSTLGVNDVDGESNLYIENNTFNGMVTGVTDFDDGSRAVFRYNTLNHSSVNSHGLATSPVGARHYEVYGNDFNYPDTTVNQNWHIWLRGGTGVIFDNSFDDINGQDWGDKTEFILSVRAIDQIVCCVSYPCEHQIGQGHDGVSQVSDPLYIWNNTGTLAWGFTTWSDLCGNGEDINDYLQAGRDFIFASKPGYTPYPYPHPLTQSRRSHHWLRRPTPNPESR